MNIDTGRREPRYAAVLFFYTCHGEIAPFSQKVYGYHFRNITEAKYENQYSAIGL